MNNDIRLRIDFLTNRKTKRLRQQLGADGVLALISLWIAIAQDDRRCEDGVLEGWKVEDIALAADWQGNAGDFVRAMVEIGWLEEMERTYKLHDWEENQPWVAGAKARSKRASKAGRTRWDNAQSNAQTTIEQCSSPSLPLPFQEEKEEPPGGEGVPSPPPSPERIRARKSETTPPPGGFFSPEWDREIKRDLPAVVDWDFIVDEFRVLGDQLPENELRKRYDRCPPKWLVFAIREARRYKERGCIKHDPAGFMLAILDRWEMNQCCDYEKGNNGRDPKGIIPGWEPRDLSGGIPEEREEALANG